MVDFNSDATVTSSPKMLINILILQRRHDTIDAIESYHRLAGKGGQPGLYEIRARLYSLLLEVNGSLNNKCPKELKGITREIIWEANEDKLFQMFNNINNWLYQKGLTKFDTYIVYDKTHAEEENKAKGL